MSEYTEILKSIGIKTLGIGRHGNSEGACLIEAYSLLVGRPKSDDPGDDILCPVLRAASIGINDAISNDDRRTELLAPLLPRLKDAGASSESLRKKRSLKALDWLICTYLPTWLSLVPALADHSAMLLELPEVTEENAPSIGDKVRAARDAAWGSAWAAVGDSAWVAARAAVGDSAWAAARDAAWTAAKDAAGAAAWAAAMTAARDAAWAAKDAAWAAAWAAACASAGDAAWDALRPTVESLQASFVELLGQLIAMVDP